MRNSLFETGGARPVRRRQGRNYHWGRHQAAATSDFLKTKNKKQKQKTKNKNKEKERDYDFETAIFSSLSSYLIKEKDCTNQLHVLVHVS